MQRYLARPKTSVQNCSTRNCRFQLPSHRKEVSTKKQRIADQLFFGKAKCSTCQVEPTGSGPGWNLHTAGEIGTDDFQASRSSDKGRLFSRWTLSGFIGC